MLLIAQVRGELFVQCPLEHRLGHLGQQPARAEQLDSFGLRLGQQLVRGRRVDQRPLTRRRSIRSAWHHLSVRHRVIPSESSFRTQTRATSLTQTF
jgi:hypothetical protein